MKSLELSKCWFNYKNIFQWYLEVFYHVYNHANGKENLFAEAKNYNFFLEKISLYILPFINLHVYCLLPNHFHLLISIKELEEIKLLESFKTFQKLPGYKLQPLINKKISKSFSNLFSSYAQSFNKVYERKGSLFMPNMKPVLIDDERGICNLIHYIHANPVHHGFVKELCEWKSVLITHIFRSQLQNFHEKQYWIFLEVRNILSNIISNQLSLGVDGMFRFYKTFGKFGTFQKLQLSLYLLYLYSIGLQIIFKK